MAITLIEDSKPARVTKSGFETVTVVAGKTVKIETTPDGVEVLNVVVPEGKSWIITFSVHIQENDA